MTARRAEFSAGAIALRLSRWTDLRRTHRLSHTKEDGDTLPAAVSRDCFGRHSEATVYVLPVVYYPDVARRPDCEIGLHLQTSADVSAGRRDLVTGLHAERAVLSAHAAQLCDRT